MHKLEHIQIMQCFYKRVILDFLYAKEINIKVAQNNYFSVQQMCVFNILSKSLIVSRFIRRRTVDASNK